ncbi:tRNA uridine-5-carboxymethylaminomethyl(34) synthesis GTPase MnmE [Candidatus Neptunochlamydia vexilliferae]|uniref:tRNA modification GTPase MnmE n=1 Tax=Candidatus Neptunichlamydia vexilliferae TaxID=1651774 RepID=A0ABS0AXR3_9BACT|nr:tRNA uridine-5-carboxymethylaminomethyl(34) synthesis GTPase MnmE [Candidatus Neptunochlamydia vexilliferae]MBF5058755.1 tRNA modification GTPase MnmE [Candidatus Neptunochlamydia vexilliferae]
MEFNHRTYEPGQTIAAVATPPGEGGIAVVRIAGDEALDVADQIFSGPIKKYKSHTVHFGKILGADGEVIDEGLAVVMKNPCSYTGEDTVEIHCHGGVIITRKVLDAALKAGARAALPGEFTFKAFQNRKIDLTRAEAVQQVIASKSELAWQAAESHLEGKLYKKISEFQTRLTSIAAILEAWVDFPEEGLEFASKEELCGDLQELIRCKATLHQTFYDGKMVRTGFSLCLIGAPNVGKSSLMNALSGKERSIVTNIPGTTRDVLEEDVEIAGMNFRLIDTAGIRETEEVVEKEGVRRSEKAAKGADLILVVCDVTDPEPPALALPEKKTIAIWNKVDLEHGALPQLPYSHQVKISAKEGEGIETLKSEIHRVIWQEGPPSKEEVILTSERHHQALGNAIEALEKVLSGLQTEISPEFLVSDIRLALKELGTIIGMNITEEVLSAIFSKFCVGK